MNLLQYYTRLQQRNKIVSDKGTDHSYIAEYYNNLFTPFKDKDISLLELGIYNGHSIELWRSFFTKAFLYAIDIGCEPIVNIINNTFEKTKAYKCNGYDASALLLFKENSLEFIIDDGPHDVNSQIFVVENWTNKLKTGGIAIIEDINNDENKDLIIKAIDKKENLSYKIFDFRKIKNRPDDVIIEVTKNF